MVSGSGTSNAILIGVVLAILIAGACWALFVGLRARRAAASMISDNAYLRTLIGTGPALAMLVRSDGRLELSGRLAEWFGLPAPPLYFADLSAADAGLLREDMETLARDIAIAQKTGRDLNIAIAVRGSLRRLMIKGQRAPLALNAPGGVILWVFDATESQAEIARLEAEGAAFRAAFDALTGLIEAAPLPMWYRGTDLRLSMVNSAYVEAVEAANAEDAVDRGLELVEGSGIGGPLAGAVAARDSGEPQARGMPATIHGARRMLRVYDVPLPTGGVAGFAVDVEDLEQARAGAKRFAEAQRAMLDRLSAGVAQFAPDRTLVFCNQPFRRLFAMRSEWIADRPEFERVLERMREANRLPEVRDFPGWKAERRDWFVATGEAIEEAWLLPSGVHLRVVAHPLPDGGLLLIFEDRTEQVQLASARDTLLRVRTATFDNLSEALGVFATDGRLQLWNNRFRTIWGFEDEFLSGHPRVDALAEAGSRRLVDPERARLLGDLVRAATVERQQRGGELAFADGRYFEFGAVPLPDGNGLLTMLDVSDNRRIQRALSDRNEALEAADRIKTAFVAHMSYELRTPLTSISGFAEMLHEGYAGKLTKQADGYVAAILESVARLGALVDDVLDLTRNDGDAPPLERSDVDLAALARSAAETIEPLAKAKQIDFAIEVAPSTGSVKGDGRRLRQALENLLRHAVAETHASGRVLLHADGSLDRARIVVSDNGAGMDAEAVAHAFDRFARPGITQDGERALGLGLPLARQFVEAHGGTIDLVSEPGEGSLITVELPRG